MEIIKAGINELEAICELYEQFYAYYATMQPEYYRPAKADPEHCKSVINSDNNDIFLAFEDGKAIGMCRVMQKDTPPTDFYVPHKFAVLMDVFVKSEHRGGGIGRALTTKGKEWSKARGLDYLELRVLQLNDFARRFYEREGFDVTAHTMRAAL